MKKPRTHQTEAGATLLELLLVVVMSGFALTAITSFILRSRSSMNQVESMTDMIAANRVISNNLRSSLNTCEVLLADYGGGSNFSALRTAINNSIGAQASSVPRPVSFSAQALVQDQDHPLFTTGANAGHVGNELYFVASLPPVTVTAWLVSSCATCTAETASVPNLAAGTNVVGYAVSVDRVQFVAIYLSQPSGLRPLKNGQPAMRLVEWRSKPYLDWGPLEESMNSVGSEPYRLQTYKALYDYGYTIAVKTDSLTTNSYVTIDAAGNTTLGAVPANLGQSSWAYLDEFDMVQSYRINPGQNFGRQSRFRTGTQSAGGSQFSMAYNTLTSSAVPVAKADFNIAAQSGGKMKVPKYATVDRGGANFPGGFEVLVVGRPHARELYVRHVLMASGAMAVRAAQNSFIAHEGEDYITIGNLY